MRLVSFDVFRTCRMAQAHYIKPELQQQHLQLIQEADWCLFPDYWQVHGLHYGLGKRIFPSLASYHLGHNKIEFTRIMQLLWPRHVPDTFIMQNTQASREVILSLLDFPFVAKTPKSSEGRGVFLIQTTEDFRSYCDLHPVLYVQEYLPIDRDCRIVVIGDAIFGSYWRIGGDAFHNNLAQGGQLSFDPVPESAKTLVLEIAKRLNIDHAGFDVAMVGDHPYLFEFNRLFGNHGLSAQGLDPSEAIEHWLRRQIEPEVTPPQLPPLQAVC